MPFEQPNLSHHDTPPQELHKPKIEPIEPIEGLNVEDRNRFIERKRDDLVWRSLWRADAALRVEDYFRRSPKDPSIDDMMDNIDLAPNSVDKDFLRACSVVASKFREQSESAASVMEFLEEQNTRDGIQNTEETLGKALYVDMMKGKMPLSYIKANIKLKQENGFFLLTIDGDEAYNALFGERPSEISSLSGGVFHRSQEVTIAKRKVPVIVVRGEQVGSLETDPVMVHEMQHWINEGLTGLGYMEKSQHGLFALHRDDRQDAIKEQNAERRIKDEVLAYLREGRSGSVEKTLLKPLYAHLFKGNPRNVEKRKQKLKHIQESFNRFAPLLQKHDRLKGILTYMLLPISLGHIATRLDTIRTTFERTDGLNIKEQSSVDPVFSKRFPTAFSGTLDGIDKAQRAIKEALYEEQRFMSPSHNTRKKHLEYANIQELKRQAFQKLELVKMPIEKGFHGGPLPYVKKIDGIESLNWRDDGERSSVREVLDAVQQMSEPEIEAIYLDDKDVQNSEEDGGNKKAQPTAEKILRQISSLIRDRFSEEPDVKLEVRPEGIQINVTRLKKEDDGERTIHYVVNIPRK